MTPARLGGWVAMILCALTATASAHPLSFGVLELREREASRYDVTFRFSGTEQRATGAEPVLPSRCRSLAPPRAERVPEGGEARRWSVDCGAAGISGGEITVHGLEYTGVQVLVRVVHRDGTVLEALLDDARRSWTVPVALSPWRVLAGYFQLGLRHIVAGLDHLLFVLGLLLLAQTPRRVLATVTAFTVGHSLTLALAALGIVRPPVAPIEAAIALSILLVAVELARPEHAPPTLTQRRPWAVAAAFGLLHGFGFAGALASTGLPRGAIAVGLLGFNAGVEAGQLLFVALCALVARWLPAQRALRRAAPYAIGIVASYWCFDRLAAVLAGW